MVDVQTAQENLKNQRYKVALLLSGAIMVIIAVLWQWNKAEPPQKAPETPSEQENSIATNTSKLSQSEVYLAKTEGAFMAQKEATETLKAQIEQLNTTQQSREEADKVNQLRFDQLQQRITELENVLKAAAPTQNKPAMGVAEDGSALPVLPMPNADKDIKGTLPPAIPPKTTIKNNEINLTLSKKVSTTIVEDRNPQTYVPAGTFASAVLLSGLDASAGVTSQSQPRPVLLRVVDDGTLPNHKQSHLQDCLITAAGYGDISSERAYIRLERMSCTKEKEVITDFPVFGYVSGPDGKAGIRGIPVWREGVLLQRGFVSGLFSGLGQGVANGFTTTSVSPLGTTQTVSGSDIAKQGIASGAGTALGKLADYNIQRAEQYQPIIQVSAGTTVEVVFHTGFYLDGRGRPESQESLSNEENNPQEVSA